MYSEPVKHLFSIQTQSTINKMGWFWGDDKTNAPQAGVNANISSTVAIGHAVNIENEDIVLLLTIICFIKFLELGLFIYREHRHRLKI